MKLLHLWTYFGEPDVDTKRRMGVAQKTWSQFDTNCKIDTANLRRDSRYIGDCSPAPFVRDLIDSVAVSFPDDAILMSNADIGFLPHASNEIRPWLIPEVPVHMRRRDFTRITDPFSPHVHVTSGGDYPGMDACAFTCAWWERNRRSLPDVVFGRQFWDAAMRNLIRSAGGIELRNLLWHETHASQWHLPACNRVNLYNEQLVCKWIGEHGGSNWDYKFTNEELRYR